MTHNPVCGKCQVVKALAEVIEAYEEFVEYLTQKNLDVVSDHARGYCHAQLTMADDVIDDLIGLIPVLKQEAELRARSNKGL